MERVTQTLQFLTWRKFEPVAQYPETSSPQNDIEIRIQESRACFDPDMCKAGYHSMEAQIGN